MLQKAVTPEENAENKSITGEREEERRVVRKKKMWSRAQFINENLVGPLFDR